MSVARGNDNEAAAGRLPALRAVACQATNRSLLDGIGHLFLDETPEQVERLARPFLAR